MSAYTFTYGFFDKSILLSSEHSSCDHCDDSTMVQPRFFAASPNPVTRRSRHVIGPGSQSFRRLRRPTDLQLYL